MAKNHKVAVVTGSTGGIGEGIVRRLAADGFTVAVSGRRIAKGEEIARNITDEGGTACFLPTDMADAEACRRLIEAAADRYQRLDVLVNNADVFPIAEIQDTTAEMWDQVYAVNVRGPFLCSQSAIPYFRKQGGGSIVNIGSTTPLRSRGDRVAHASSKGALLTMTKVLARALLADRNRVNWVTVGRDMPGNSGRESLDKVYTKAPLGRLENVEGIAAGVPHLVSEGAGHVTGCELNISGGFWI